MNMPQTRFTTLSAMKLTNTDHTAIGYHTKCRMNHHFILKAETMQFFNFCFFAYDF